MHYDNSQFCFYKADNEARYSIVLSPSSRRQATVHRTVAFIFSSLRLHNIKKKQMLKHLLLFYGAGDEARTRYLHLGKVALYQMSYTRVGYVDIIALFFSL